jgi:hypothetical protein
MDNLRKQILLEKLAESDSKAKRLAKGVGGAALGAVLGAAVGGPANAIRRVWLSNYRAAKAAKAHKKLSLAKRVGSHLRYTGQTGTSLAVEGITGLAEGANILAKGIVAGGVGGGALGGYLASRKKRKNDE